jgi:hypothetical protein
MLENVYPRSFSSAALGRKPESSTLRTTMLKIFGRIFDPQPGSTGGLKVGFTGLSSSNSPVAGSQSRSTFLSHLAGGRGWVYDVYNFMLTILCWALAPNRHNPGRQINSHNPGRREKGAECPTSHTDKQSEHVRADQKSRACQIV